LDVLSAEAVVCSVLVLPLIVTRRTLSKSEWWFCFQFDEDVCAIDEFDEDIYSIDEGAGSLYGEDGAVAWCGWCGTTGYGAETCQWVCFSLTRMSDVDGCPMLHVRVQA